MAKVAKNEDAEMRAAIETLGGVTEIPEQNAEAFPGQVTEVQGKVLDSVEALNPWEDPETTFVSSELLAAESMDDLQALFSAKGVGTSEGEEIKTGYEGELDKADLVGVPFTFVWWKFIMGENIEKDPVTGASVIKRSQFVRAAIMTVEGEKGYITDGSGYGVCHQLSRISASRHNNPKPGVKPAMGLRAPKGLEERQNKNGGKSSYTIAHLN